LSAGRWLRSGDLCDEFADRLAALAAAADDL
jgi:hypothetical protein